MKQKLTNIRSKFGRMSDNKNIALLLMALPGIGFLFVFRYLPMAGIIIAFKKFRYDLGILASEWVGFKNFQFFFNSQDFWRITRNTVGLNALFITSGVIVSVALALMLREVSKRLHIKIYQTVFFFPHFLSWVVVSFMLFSFLNMRYGIINRALEALGFQSIMWYVDPSYWPAILLIVYLWKNAGYFCIIYYAGLMGIDNELYEAAAIDGANKWQMVTKISIPLIKPLIIIMVLLQVGRIFYADFGMFFHLPRDIGMLYPTTDVIDTYVYRSLRVVGDIGMSSAVNFYQAIVGFTLVVSMNYIVRKLNAENALF